MGPNPLPDLIVGTEYTPLLTGSQWALVALCLFATVAWSVTAGRRTTWAEAWVSVSLGFCTWDVLLNLLADERYDVLWWASLGMRVAQFGVLAAGLLHGLATLLRSLDHETLAVVEEAGAALRKGEQFSHDVLDSLRAQTAVLDADGRIVVVNRSWVEFFEDRATGPSTCCAGVSYLDVCDRSAAAGCADAGMVAAGIRSVLEGRARSYEYDYLLDGDEWFAIHVAPLSSSPGALVAHIDITERKRFEARLTQLALHDHVTGLPNRTLFSDRLGNALARSPRRPRSVAVLFLDLDRFKVVNDSLGHVVVPTASIGVAIEHEGSTAETLLRDADAAMYQAKERGRARSVVFDEGTRQRAADRLHTEDRLRTALDPGELAVHCRPPVDLEDGRGAGFEALVR